MLPKKEIKRVQTYGILLEIALPSLIMTFVLLGVWLILETIEGLVFHGLLKFSATGLWIVLSFDVIYLVLFGYSVIRVRFGTSGKKWKSILNGEIEQDNDMPSEDIARAVGTMAAGRIISNSSNETISDIGDVTQLAGAVDTISAAEDVISIMINNVNVVAKHYKIVMPSAKKYVLLIIFVPLILLIPHYIPRYIQAHNILQEEVRVVQDVQSMLMKNFEKYFDSVSIDDPTEYYQEYGYQVYGYLENEGKTNVQLRINSEGNIKEIMYNTDLIVGNGIEENIEIFNSYIDDISKIIDMSVESDLSKIKNIPQQLVDAYYEEENKEDFHELVELEDVNVSFSSNVGSDDILYFYFTVYAK